MTVIFSVNGQVHGHYTSEFISRTLKFQLLKDYVLIHVDCTDLDMDFRHELFMASRDRLKDGKESRELRRRLGTLLRNGRLKEIYKARKAQISVDDSDAEVRWSQFFGQVVKVDSRTEQEAPRWPGRDDGSRRSSRRE